MVKDWYNGKGLMKAIRVTVLFPCMHHQPMHYMLSTKLKFKDFALLLLYSLIYLICVLCFVHMSYELRKLSNETQRNVLKQFIFPRVKLENCSTLAKNRSREILQICSTAQLRNLRTLGVKSPNISMTKCKLHVNLFKLSIEEMA
jgi:hypothetical protein